MKAVTTTGKGVNGTARRNNIINPYDTSGKNQPGKQGEEPDNDEGWTTVGKKNNVKENSKDKTADEILLEITETDESWNNIAKMGRRLTDLEAAYDKANDPEGRKEIEKMINM